MGPSPASAKPPPATGSPPTGLSAESARWLLQEALLAGGDAEPPPEDPLGGAGGFADSPAGFAPPPDSFFPARPGTEAATAWQPPRPEDLNGLLKDYQFIEMIGRGGMGAVYLGLDTRLDREVAIKILPPELSRLPGFADRFRREAWALARLEHPHIVRIHQSGTTSAGHLYFVMEYLVGSNLAQCLERRRQENGGPPFPQEQVLEIACQVCGALEGAHERGIIHRDIKPANLLLDESGHVKLVDFGLARPMAMADPGPYLTATHQVMGTRDYMAPELLAGKEIDARVDVYATGVLLYEMLTGEVPRGVFQPPSKLQPVDRRLDGIVATAMQSDPARRYHSITELHSALESLRRSGCERGKRRGEFALAGMTAALFIGLGLTLWDADRRNRVRTATPPLTMIPTAGDAGNPQESGDKKPGAGTPVFPTDPDTPATTGRTGLIFAESFDIRQPGTPGGPPAGAAAATSTPSGAAVDPESGLPGFTTESPYIDAAVILPEGLSYQDADGRRLAARGGAALLDAGARGGTISVVTPISLEDGPESELWISLLARQTGGTNARFINLCLRGQDNSTHPPDSDLSLDEVLAIGMRSRIGAQVWQIWDRSTFGTFSRAAESTAPTTLTTFLLVRWQRDAEQEREKATLWINPALSRDPVESAGFSFVSTGSDIGAWSQIQHLRLGAGHGGGGSPSSAWIVDEIRLGWTRADVTPH